jgi:hypothetical protein
LVDCYSAFAAAPAIAFFAELFTSPQLLPFLYRPSCSLSLSDLLSAELVVRRPFARAVFAANFFPNCNCLAGCVTIGGVGGRLVKHARYYWMVLAEGHLTRTRFAAMLRRIALLPLPAS